MPRLDASFSFHNVTAIHLSKPHTLYKSGIPWQSRTLTIHDDEGSSFDITLHSTDYGTITIDSNTNLEE